MLLFYFVKRHWLSKHTCHENIVCSVMRFATIKTTKNNYMNSVWLVDKKYVILDEYTLSIS